MRKLILLALCAVLLFVTDLLLQKQPERLLLPEAQNDVVIAAIGFGGPSETAPAEPEPAAPQASAPPFPGGAAESVEPVTSVAARPLAESYPVGSSEILLEVTNNGDRTLGYTLWFDIRKVEGEMLVPLPVQENSVPDFDTLESFRLEAGETVQIPVRLDFSGEPLPDGIYRASQLACFEDAKGNALACTEISAEFTLK